MDPRGRLLCTPLRRTKHSIKGAHLPTARIDEAKQKNTALVTCNNYRSHDESSILANDGHNRYYDCCCFVVFVVMTMLKSAIVTIGNSPICPNLTGRSYLAQSVRWEIAKLLVYGLQPYKHFKRTMLIRRTAICKCRQDAPKCSLQSRKHLQRLTLQPLIPSIDRSILRSNLYMKDQRMEGWVDGWMDE